MLRCSDFFKITARFLPNFLVIFYPLYNEHSSRAVKHFKLTGFKTCPGNIRSYPLKLKSKLKAWTVPRKFKVRDWVKIVRCFFWKCSMLKPLELHSVRSGPPLEQIISTGLTLKIGPNLSRFLEQPKHRYRALYTKFSCIGIALCNKHIVFVLALICDWNEPHINMHLGMLFSLMVGTSPPRNIAHLKESLQVQHLKGIDSIWTELCLACNAAPGKSKLYIVTLHVCIYIYISLSFSLSVLYVYVHCTKGMLRIIMELYVLKRIQIPLWRNAALYT